MASSWQVWSVHSVFGWWVRRRGVRERGFNTKVAAPYALGKSDIIYLWICLLKYVITQFSSTANVLTHRSAL